MQFDLRLFVYRDFEGILRVKVYRFHTHPIFILYSSYIHPI